MKKLLAWTVALFIGAGLAFAQSEAAQVGENTSVNLSEQGFLVDADGRTLYLFLRDEGGVSSCTDACLINWPPLRVGEDVELLAGEGVNQELLGTSEMPDGTLQVTYAGWPLYYYIADNAAGLVSGQGIGEVWYVLDAEGNMIEELAD